MPYYAYDEKGKQYRFEELDTGKSLLLTLKKETIWSVKKLQILPELGAAKAGDDGYWILPRNIDMQGDIQTLFTPRADVSFWYTRPVMSWYGIKKADLCAVVRVDRNYFYRFDITVKDNIYQVTPTFDFTQRDPVYDDIRVELVFLPVDADYNHMAKAERELRFSRGELRTLAEKCQSPAVEYARKYPLVRIRMGWKPSPSPVLHQTEQTEPPMLAACDFKRVREIADELKRQGVEGAELQLVGWHRGGHDGRFPQIFPAEPALGGNAEFRKTVDHVKALGYRISTHTNGIDSFEIADTFDWQDAVVMRDGSYKQRGHFSGGLAYRVCLLKQFKNAKRDLPPLAAFGENGVHFTDVISILPPDDCHSPAHPSSTQNSILYAQKIMEYTRGLFGAFSSEGCMDFALKELDFGLYVTFGNGFGEKAVPVADRYLPIFELTYHGTVLYNPTSPTVNYPLKGPAERLTLYLRGGKPAMYYYSKFRTGGQKNWMGETDLLCNDEKELRESVALIKQAAEEYAPFADKQLLTMETYDIPQDGVEIATYSDGSRVVGNFNKEPILFEGVTVPGEDFAVLEK